MKNIEQQKIDMVQALLHAIYVFAGAIVVQIFGLSSGSLIYSLYDNKITYEEAFGILSGTLGSAPAGLIAVADIVSAVMVLIYGLIIYIKICGARTDNIRSALRLKPALIAAAAGASSSIILTVLLTLISMIPGTDFSKYSSIVSDLSKLSVLNFLYVCLVGPVTEEVLFRGAIMKELSAGFSISAANALQALFFGIYHMNLIQGIYAFVLGIVLGITAHRGKSLMMPVVMHICFNVTSILITLIPF
ncbi:MAG: type II CAAX endopeptidase family protein [Lachnospiraceae bacterium]|jgi:membrane protease YdiL (CAAX protease family)|nr:type II CAAX endopeptidase family protein [Lachnospiraceae bacterium]